jgi:tRNA dimethylallyltransferase
MTLGPSPDCVCLTAPTACGKTELALELAARLPVEIVSMDSAMVYRGMDIGTAKPDPATRAAVPHHLVDIVDPVEAYSAGRFARDAAAAIAAIRGRGKLPLVVGGTLLYLKALRDGLAPLPRDPQVRAELDAEAETIGFEGLHRLLAEIDPAAAARIAPADRQRIQRALEVFRLTGKPLSALQQRAAQAPRPAVATLALVPGDRAALAERIADRFDAMVAAGFVDEVRRLKSRGDLGAGLPAMRAVGYRQLWAHLDGRWGWDETRQRAIVATRQLAKRQMTWLRTETAAATLPALAPDLTDRAAAAVGKLLPLLD